MTPATVTYTYYQFWLSSGVQFPQPERHEHCVGVSSRAWAPLLSPSVLLPEVFTVRARISYVPGVGAGPRSNVLHLSVEREF